MVSGLRGNDSPGAEWQFRKLTQAYMVAYLRNAAVVASTAFSRFMITVVGTLRHMLYLL